MDGDRSHPLLTGITQTLWVELVVLFLRNLIASINLCRSKEVCWWKNKVGTLTPFHWVFKLLKCIWRTEIFKKTVEVRRTVRKDNRSPREEMPIKMKGGWTSVWDSVLGLSWLGSKAQESCWNSMSKPCYDGSICGGTDSLYGWVERTLSLPGDNW